MEFDSVDTSGTNGSGAVVQQVQNAGFGSSVSVTLVAFGDASNRPYAAFSLRSTLGTFTPESGYEELADQQSAGDNNATHAVEWHETSADVSPTGTFSGSQDWMGYGVEIKFAAAPAPAAPIPASPLVGNLRW